LNTELADDAVINVSVSVATAMIPAQFCVWLDQRQFTQCVRLCHTDQNSIPRRVHCIYNRDQGSQHCARQRSQIHRHSRAVDFLSD
jgi:hypothetical protein